MLLHLIIGYTNSLKKIMSNKKTKVTKAKRTILKNNKRNTTKSIWGNNNSNTINKKTTNSIAPAKRTDAVKAKYAPKKGTIAAKIVDTIVPKTSGQALTMIAGGGAVKAFKTLKKGYQTVKALKTIKTTKG